MKINKKQLLFVLILMISITNVFAYFDYSQDLFIYNDFNNLTCDGFLYGDCSLGYFQSVNDNFAGVVDITYFNSSDVSTTGVFFDYIYNYKNDSYAFICNDQYYSACAGVFFEYGVANPINIGDDADGFGTICPFSMVDDTNYKITFNILTNGTEQLYIDNNFICSSQTTYNLANNFDYTLVGVKKSNYVDKVYVGLIPKSSANLTYDSIFYESFTDSFWSLDDSDCDYESTNVNSILATTGITLDNVWKCGFDKFGGSAYNSDFDLTWFGDSINCNSDVCMFQQSRNLTKNWVYFTTKIVSEFPKTDFTNDIYFEFSCRDYNDNHVNTSHAFDFINSSNQYNSGFKLMLGNSTTSRGCGDGGDTQDGVWGRYCFNIDDLVSDSCVGSSVKTLIVPISAIRNMSTDSVGNIIYSLSYLNGLDVISFQSHFYGYDFRNENPSDTFTIDDLRLFSTESFVNTTPIIINGTNVIIPYNNTLPTINSIIYSDTTIDLNLEDTIYINSTATDVESDDIYWAYTCDYSGETNPVRTSEEYMDVGTNINDLKERFNLDCPNIIDFGNVYERDSLIGYVWNITHDSCLDDFYRNVSGSSGISSDSITTHLVYGFDAELLSDSDGLLIAGRRNDGQFLWAVFMDANYTSNTNRVFRMDNTGTFYLINISSNLEDRVLVDVNSITGTYVIKLDIDADDSIDYISSEYNTYVSPTNYHDTYFVTTGQELQTGDDFFDLGISTTQGEMWIDTLYVEYSSLPLFNNTPSNNNNFQCIYTGLGTYEIRTWVTDNYHPNNYSSYESQNILVVQGTIPPSVSCSGYTAPTCTGTCYFYDTFNENYSISCNNWQGADGKYPTSNEMRVEQTNMNGLSIYSSSTLNAKDTITSLEYNSFTFEFDFTPYTNQLSTFILTDSTQGSYITYLYWQNGNMYAYQSANPNIVNLGIFPLSEQHKVNGLVDYTQEEVSVWFDGDTSNIQTISFYDLGTDNMGAWIFTPVDFDNSDLGIDNFKIIYGNDNPDFNPDAVVDTEYVYNSNLFCAINWTSNTFSQQNCIDRGFDPNKSTYSFCLPTACVQDTISMVFGWFMTNILITIVVIVLLILIIPLLISMRR